MAGTPQSFKAVLHKVPQHSVDFAAPPLTPRRLSPRPPSRIMSVHARPLPPPSLSQFHMSSRAATASCACRWRRARWRVCMARRSPPSSSSCWTAGRAAAAVVRVQANSKASESADRSRAEFSQGRLPTAMLMDVDAFRCSSRRHTAAAAARCAAYRCGTGRTPSLFVPSSTLCSVPLRTPCSPCPLTLQHRRPGSDLTRPKQSCASSTLLSWAAVTTTQMLRVLSPCCSPRACPTLA
jgi:hypothetical protein